MTKNRRKKRNLEERKSSVREKIKIQKTKKWPF